MFPKDGSSRMRALARKLWLHRIPYKNTGTRNVCSSSVNQNSQFKPGSGNAGKGLGPLLASAGTCGVFSLVSDTIVQSIELQASRKKAKGVPGIDCCTYDPLRSGRMLSFGLLFYGPLQHFWYALLDKQFSRRSYLPHFASKVALNQVVLGPVVLMSVFAWNLAFQHKLDELGEKAKRDFVPSMLNGWKFWVPAACVNFWLIPLKRQVLFMSACSIGWTGYLSYASNLKAHSSQG